MTNRNRLTIASTEPTRYEVAVYDRTGAVAKVLGYTVRRTQAVLFGMVMTNRDMIAVMMTDADELIYTKANGYACDACRVAFTGRTERDAAQ